MNKVWEESSGESLLQIQILIGLRNFVIALGYQSPICYNTLLPILEKGIDMNSPDELNLLEDSMLVSFSDSCPYLLVLFQYVIARPYHLACFSNMWNVMCSYGKLPFLMLLRWYLSYCHTFHVWWKSWKEVLITCRLIFLQPSTDFCQVCSIASELSYERNMMRNECGCKFFFF